MDNEGTPVFLIDSSALQGMFEGREDNSSKEMTRKMKAIKDNGGKVHMVTPLASFLRAIWLADPKVTIGEIQKTLSFLKITFSQADFKSEEATRNEILEIVRMMGELQK